MRIQRLQPIKECTESTTDPDFSLLNPLIQKYKNKKGNLIPLLQGVQAVYGYIPSKAFEYLHENTGLEISDMYGVATFYAQFRLRPVGKHIVKVCHGTACHVQNASEVSQAILDALDVKDGETTADGWFTVESVACLGCCSLAPVMMIGDDTYGKLTGKEAVKIIKEIKIKEVN